MRGRAAQNSYNNDSVFAQFSSSVDQAGAFIYRIGTTSSLPLIGEAAVAAYGTAGGGRPREFNAEAFYHFRGRVNGQETTVMEMKARQMAWAVKRVEGLWLRAWREAAAESAQTGGNRAEPRR